MEKRVGIVWAVFQKAVETATDPEACITDSLPARRKGKRRSGGRVEVEGDPTDLSAPVATIMGHKREVL